MKEPGGFDYLDSVSKDAGDKPRQQGNMQTVQEGLEASPAEGGEGYVGGNSNAGRLGMDFVTGKKGSTRSSPIWSEQTDSQEGQSAPVHKPAGSDSTEEGASYHDVRSGEGLPQTYRDSKGAGDAGPSDGPTGEFSGKKGGQDAEGFGYLAQASRSGNPTNPGIEDVQEVPAASEGDHDMEMPQTEFTSQDGGGAPRFKHGG